MPVLLDRVGSLNVWHKPRYEGGKGPFGIAKGDGTGSAFVAVQNRVDMGYFSGATQSGWLEVAGAFANVWLAGSNASPLTWHSGPLHDVLSTDGTMARVKPPLFLMRSADGTPRRVSTTATQLTSNALGLQVPNGVIVAIEINTETMDGFSLNWEALTGFGGRAFIAGCRRVPRRRGGTCRTAARRRSAPDEDADPGPRERHDLVLEVASL